MYGLLNCVAILCMWAINPLFVGRFVGFMILGATLSRIRVVRDAVHGFISSVDKYLHGTK